MRFRKLACALIVLSFLPLGAAAAADMNATDGKETLTRYGFTLPASLAPSTTQPR